MERPGERQRSGGWPGQHHLAGRARSRDTITISRVAEATVGSTSTVGGSPPGSRPTPSGSHRSGGGHLHRGRRGRQARADGERHGDDDRARPAALLEKVRRTSSPAAMAKGSAASERTRDSMALRRSRTVRPAATSRGHGHRPCRAPPASSWSGRVAAGGGGSRTLCRAARGSSDHRWCGRCRRGGCRAVSVRPGWVGWSTVSAVNRAASTSRNPSLRRVATARR